MGFLDMFRPRHADYRLEEAMQLIEKDLRMSQAKNREVSYQNTLNIHWDMQQLASLIEEFSGKPVPEHAKRSAAVKERFCELSKRQLESLDAPAKEDTSGFLQDARLVLDSLGGLTQRQLLHINFFFKEDFKPVARKISEINELLSQKDSASEHTRALELYGKMKTLEAKKGALAGSISADEEKLSRLKDMELPPLSQEPGDSDLNRAETKLRNLKQEIDSFLSVQKLLKKYEYVQKVNDELLAAYIESPSSALMHDDSLRIIGFVAEAAALAKGGKIDVDLPEKRVETVLVGADYLKKKRAELTEATMLVREEKGHYQHAKELFETSLHERTNELAELEAEIKHTSKLIESAKKEESEAAADLARTRTELCLLASKILDANVS